MRGPGKPISRLAVCITPFRRMAFPGDITADSSPILIGWHHRDSVSSIRFVSIIESREKCGPGGSNFELIP